MITYKNVQYFIDSLLFNKSKVRKELTPRQLQQTINQVINTLQSKESFVMYCRYLSNEKLTLQEIANILCINRERVRQIEAKALRKLRHPSRLRALQNLLT